MAARDDATTHRTTSRMRAGGAKTRKSAATREKIMAAASELMVERGSTDFQMSEVSERCQMSKGSLYYYFSDRSELVRAVFDRAIDETVAEVEAAVAQAPSATESIFGLVEVLAKAVRPPSPLALSMAVRAGSARSSATPLPSVEGRLTRIVDILSAQFERAKGEGLVREDVDSTLGAIAIAGAFLVYEYAQPDTSTVEGEDLVRQILDLAFSGMGTERARALFASRPKASD